MNHKRWNRWDKAYKDEVYKLEYTEMEYTDNNDYKFEFYDGKVLTIRWDTDILTKESETAGRK